MATVDFSLPIAVGSATAGGEAWPRASAPAGRRRPATAAGLRNAPRGAPVRTRALLETQSRSEDLGSYAVSRYLFHGRFRQTPGRSGSAYGIATEGRPETRPFLPWNRPMPAPRPLPNVAPSDAIDLSQASSRCSASRTGSRMSTTRIGCVSQAGVSAAPPERGSLRARQ